MYFLSLTSPQEHQQTAMQLDQQQQQEPKDQHVGVPSPITPANKLAPHEFVARTPSKAVAGTCAEKTPATPNEVCVCACVCVLLYMREKDAD